MYFAIPVKDRFPPHIYYKLFTHRPVQDIGAFSPGDYTSSDFKRKAPPCDVHNKIPRRKPVRGLSGNHLHKHKHQIETVHLD